MVQNLRMFFKMQLPCLSRIILNPVNLPKVSPQSRLCSTTIRIKKNKAANVVHHRIDQEYKTTKKAAVNTLEQLLNISTFDALGIVTNNPFFQQVSKFTLKTNHVLLSKARVHHETMVKYPEILTLADLELKLAKIQKLPYEINDVVVLLTLPIEGLTKVLRKELSTSNDEGKIRTLVTSLQISPQKACECIASKPFLLNLSTEKIKQKIKVLLSYGISSEEVCNDLWVLNYTEDLIRSRLEFAKENHIDTLKTWMVRAKQEIFHAHIQRESENKSILGDNSLVEYLSAKLECSNATVNYMILKQPALKNKSLKKLEELIDFLHAEGFQSHQICRVPKILVHSVETTRKRLKQLDEQGIKIDGLSMLTKSQNQYMQYYEALVKSKNKSKTKT